MLETERKISKSGNSIYSVFVQALNNDVFYINISMLSYYAYFP